MLLNLSTLHQCLQKVTENRGKMKFVFWSSRSRIQTESIQILYYFHYVWELSIPVVFILIEMITSDSHPEQKTYRKVKVLRVIQAMGAVSNRAHCCCIRSSVRFLLCCQWKCMRIGVAWGAGGELQRWLGVVLFWCQN